MNITNSLPNQRLKTHKGLVKVILCYKLVFLFCFIFLSATYVNTQKGLFIKLSLGSGYTTEYSSNIGSGFTITKNHSIGWGITNNFTVHIGEYGGLIWQKVGDYNYINLDAFGLGFSYRTPIDIKISVLGDYSKVSFAHKWTEPLVMMAAMGLV